MNISNEATQLEGLTIDLGSSSRCLRFGGLSEGEVDRLSFFERNFERNAQALVSALTQIEVIHLDLRVRLTMEGVIAFVRHPSKVEVNVIGTSKRGDIVLVVDFRFVRRSGVIERGRTFLTQRNASLVFTGWTGSAKPP